MKRLTSCGLFLVVFLVILIGINRVLANKIGWYHHSVHNFVNTDKRYDVVCVGPSYVFCTINPVFVFMENGLKVYDFATPMQTIEMSYYFAKKALEKTKPKLLVVGTTMFVLSGEKQMNSDEFIHYGTD